MVKCICGVDGCPGFCPKCGGHGGGHTSDCPNNQEVEIAGIMIDGEFVAVEDLPDELWA